MFLKHYIYLNLAAICFLYVSGEETTANETNHGECILPSHPQNGKWVIIGGSDANPGSTVPLNTIISFSCEEPYKVSDDYSVIMCLGKDWNLPPPGCSNSEKPHKVKRQTISINGNDYFSIEDVRRRPNIHSRTRITDDGRGGFGIFNQNVDETVGRRGNDGIAITKKRVTIGGDEGGILIESDRGRGKKRIRIGGSRGGISVESEGDIGGGREQDGTAFGNRRISVGGNGGGIQIESEGDIGKNGAKIGKKRISVNSNQGGTVIEREGELGERDEILIGTGGKTVIVGPGEKGTIYIDKNGVVSKNGEVLGGGYEGAREGGSEWTGNNGQTDYHEDTIKWDTNGKGYGGVTVRKDRTDSYDESDNDDSVRNVPNLDVRSGSGGDRVVINRRRGNIVLDSGSGIVGIGGQPESTLITYSSKRETHPEILEGEHAQNGERIKRSPASNKKKSKNTNKSDEGEDGKDGIVVEKGESLDGYVIGVGQPGGSGARRGGRGGDGVVIKGGGRINGVVVGMGGQGGSAGSTGSNKKQNKGEQDEKEHTTTTKKPKGSKGQSSKSRIKRDPQQVLRFGLGVKIVQNSQGGILIQTTNDQTLTDNGVNVPLGGRGGQGVSGLDPSKIKGIVIDVQGANGNTYFARKRRDVEAGNRSNFEDEKEETKDRKKRQLTIAGIPFSGGRPIVVGGRGGDGLIIDGGVIHGNVVGYGGNGGNPTSKRKRRQSIDLRENIEDGEINAKENHKAYLLKIPDDPQNKTKRHTSSGTKIRVKRREGRRGRGEQQGIMRQTDDGEYTLGGPEGGIIERSGTKIRRLGTNDEGGIREIAINRDSGRDSGRDNGRDSGRDNGRDSGRDPDIDVRGGSRDDDSDEDDGDRNGARCPALLNDDMVTVTCYNDRSRIVSCESATAGISVEFKCANFYEPQTMKYQTGYCYDGEWTVDKPTCVPVCGKARLDATPQIVGGDPSTKGDYPWVAAIFQSINNNFDNVCGGSMLTQKVILTAAHCVTNQFGDALSSDLIKVGVGKYYSRYRDTRDDEAQYSDIFQILVHKSYKGINQQFASDIAILITTDTLKLSRLVQPVCYKDVAQFQLVNQMRGWVTGWGYTVPGGPKADVLKQLFVPYKDEATCRTEFPTEWLDAYLTYDKFCAGYFNRSVSVCNGDSGGGLVFRNTNGRFYVQGIVSLSIKTEELKCHIQRSTLYTRVSSHYGWITEIVSLFG